MKNGQVRIILESEEHFEKVTGITGARGKVADFLPVELLDALSHIPTRVGTAFVNLISLEDKPTTGEGSRVRNLLPLLLHRIGLDELVPKVPWSSCPGPQRIGGSPDNGVEPPPFELPI